MNNDAAIILLEKEQHIGSVAKAFLNLPIDAIMKVLKPCI